MQLNLSKKFKYIEFGFVAAALINKITKKLNIFYVYLYRLKLCLNKVKMCLL